MIIDKYIQMQPGWRLAVGNSIGGVPPAKYGFVQGFMDKPTAMLLTTQGTSGAPNTYADWMAAADRQILPNTGNCMMSFTVTVDGASVTDAQAIEFDLVLSSAKMNYLFGMQLDYSRGGVLQISDKNFGWVDVPGIVPGKLVPLIPHNFVCIYQFDMVKKEYSYVSVQIDGKTYPIPAQLQNLAAKEMSWADGLAVIQVQQDLTSKAGAYTMSVENLTLAWW